jgi:hypothetical protein
MEYWKNLSSIIQALTTTTAIVIGGVWTYLLFVRQRLNFPKVNIKLRTEDKLIPGSYRLVHVKVSIDNVGNVILRSNNAELRIRQVLPVPDDIKTAVDEEKDPVIKGKTEIEWPMLFGRKWEWEKGGFEIEPGEFDALHADYIIDDSVEVVEFYFYISNAKKKRSQLGWPITQMHKFHPEVENMADKTKKQVGVNNQQERQQKQQQQQKPQKPVKPAKPKQKK